jgi:hypothetical protein
MFKLGLKSNMVMIDRASTRSSHLRRVGADTLVCPDNITYQDEAVTELT